MAGGTAIRVSIAATVLICATAFPVGAYTKGYWAAVRARDAGDYQLALQLYNKEFRHTRTWPAGSRYRLRMEHLLYWSRGIGYRKIGAYKKAIADFSDSIEIANEYDWLSAAPPFHHRGLTYLVLFKNKRAAADFTRAIEAYPSYDDAYFRRCQTYERIGRRKRARQDCAMAVQLYESRCARWKKEKRAAGSIKRCLNTIQQHPELLKVRALLARLRD